MQHSSVSTTASYGEHGALGAFYESRFFSIIHEDTLGQITSEIDQMQFPRLQCEMVNLETVMVVCGRLPVT